MRALHVFYTLGVKPQRALYVPAHDHEAAASAQKFALTALLDMGWPVPTGRLAGASFHLLPTAELFEPIEPTSRCVCPAPPEAPSPVEQLLGELAEVSEGAAATARRDAEEQRRSPLNQRDVRTIWTIVDRLMDTVRDGDDVLIEATNGIRSISLGILLGAGLLRAHRPKVNVLAVTYAEFGAASLPEKWSGRAGEIERASPVHDLRPFFDLFDWSHASRQLTETLDSRRIAALLQRDWGGAAAASDIPTRVAELGDALAINWPSKVVGAWQAFQESVVRSSGEELRQRSPAAAIVLDHAQRDLSTLAFAAAARTEELTEERLHFDLRLIERLHQVGREGDAIRGLREWFVNAVLLASGSADTWLEGPVRARAEAALHRDTNDVGRRWKVVGRVRNAASHLGYNEKHDPTPESVTGVLHDALGELTQWMTDPEWTARFALTRQGEVWVTDQFHPAMLSGGAAFNVRVTRVKADEVRLRLGDDFRVAISDDATKAEVQKVCGREVVSEGAAGLRLTVGTAVVVAGPHAPSHKHRWHLVEVG